MTVHGPLTADPSGIVTVVKHQDYFGGYDLGTWLPGGVYIDISCP